MDEALAERIRELGRAGDDEGVAPFAGVVRVDVEGRTLLRAGFGMADRAHRIPMTASTRLAMASGSKTFTALVVLSLVEEGLLELGTPARSLLGDDLPLIPDDVTVEHLLSHRSGIGDYLDEDELDVGDYAMPVSVHRLATTADYLQLLDGHPQVFAPGAAFSYCNGGYVVLAMLAERAGGRPFHELVARRVCEPAAMASTAYLRSDSLPGDAALGRVRVAGEWRSNVFHLPVRGNGDGGAFTTADDMHRFWEALSTGRILGEPMLAQMLRPRSDGGYGLGLWLEPQVGMQKLVGEDAGVSFVSVHLSGRRTSWTVLADAAGAAWPVQRALREHVLGE